MRKYGSVDDVIYENVTFDSFCKLREEVKKNFHTFTLHYDGSHICGRLGIEFPRYGEAKRNNEFIKVASSIIEIF